MIYHHREGDVVPPVKFLPAFCVPVYQSAQPFSLLSTTTTRMEELYSYLKSEPFAIPKLVLYAFFLTLTPPPHPITTFILPKPFPPSTSHEHHHHHSQPITNYRILTILSTFANDSKRLLIDPASDDDFGPFEFSWIMLDSYSRVSFEILFDCFGGLNWNLSSSSSIEPPKSTIYKEQGSQIFIESQSEYLQTRSCMDC